MRTNVGTPLKVAEREAFKQWLALPVELREPKEQRELAEALHVDPATLSDWKLESGFMDEVVRLAKAWARQYTPDVIHALQQSATMIGMPGASSDRKLWLQYMEKFAERQEHTGPDGSPLIIERSPDGGNHTKKTSAPTPPG